LGRPGKPGSTRPAAERDPSYELTVTPETRNPGDEREPNDDLKRANAVPAGVDASGTFGRRRDEDWIRIPLSLPPAAPDHTAPPTARLELGPVDGVSVALKVLAGAEVVAEARGGRGAELRLRNVGLGSATDALTVALKAQEGRNLEARWALKVAIEPPLEGAEREPNDVIAKATPIAPGTSVSGFLWPGDVDVYCLPRGGAPGRYAFSVDGVDGVDLKLDLLDAAGQSTRHVDEQAVGGAERLEPVGEGSCVKVTGRPRDAAFDAPYRLTAQ
jgi:hypothetical protein